MSGKLQPAEDIEQTMRLMGNLGLDMRGYVGGLVFEWRAEMAPGVREMNWERLNPDPDAQPRVQHIKTTITLQNEIVREEQG